MNPLNVEPVSQRNPRWVNKKLGYGVESIGGWGCLLTCYTMLLNHWGREIRVDKVNNLMKQASGYVGDTKNLWVWRTADKVFKTEYQGSFDWDNSKVVEWLEKSIPVIVKVDAAPIGGYLNHYVLSIGGQKICDPWTGKIEPFSKYTPKGYNVYKKGGVEDMVEDTTMKIKKTKFEELVTKSTERDEWVEKMPFDNPEKVLIHMKDQKESIKGKNEEIRIAEERAEDWKKDYREIISVVAKALDTTQDRAEVIAEAKKVSDKLDKYADIRRKHDELNEEKAEMETELKSEVARLKALIKQENQLEAYDTVELIREVLKRIVKILPRS